MAICTPDENKSTVASMQENKNNIIMITNNIDRLEKQTSRDYNNICQSIEKFRQEFRDDMKQFKDIIILLGDRKNAGN